MDRDQFISVPFNTSIFVKISANCHGPQDFTDGKTLFLTKPVNNCQVKEYPGTKKPNQSPRNFRRIPRGITRGMVGLLSNCIHSKDLDLIWNLDSGRNDELFDNSFSNLRAVQW